MILEDCSLLPNLDRLAAIQFVKLWKSAIMDQLVTFRKSVYKLSAVLLKESSMYMNVSSGAEAHYQYS